MSLSGTRLAVLHAIYNTSVMGASAKEVAERARVSVSTARKHLAALRDDGSVATIGDVRCYAYVITREGMAAYEADNAPQPKVTKARAPGPRAKRPRSKKVANPESAEIETMAEAQEAKPGSLQEAIWVTLYQGGLGVFELGARTGLARNVLQEELDRMLGTLVERERAKGRWIYRRSA